MAVSPECQALAKMPIGWRFLKILVCDHEIEG